MARKKLNLEQKQLLNKARILGTATALPISLSDEELMKIISVILKDVDRAEYIPDFVDIPNGSTWDYYDMPLSWFGEDRGVRVDFEDFYLNCINEIDDFETYFKCLCDLHKRRKKYDKIVHAQPLPKMIQISPRSLLEFGVIASPALASWMTWRKWFYDIDNRAAQETGYLFEPILASALGGNPYGARNSPVKRRNDRSKGRQVDCIADQDAYEFKLRVTIAASGQGRFSEEIEFPSDCIASGFRPILLVLDPTPSHRLYDLEAEFRRVGGLAYTGGEAWDHLEERSGPTMATFIEKYVRRPIDAMTEFSGDLLDISVSTAADRRSFSVQVGEDSWSIERTEDEALAENGETPLE
jgi:hypothetical protein